MEKYGELIVGTKTLTFCSGYNAPTIFKSRRDVPTNFQDSGNNYEFEGLEICEC
jgi:hypothetical protein